MHRTGAPDRRSAALVVVGVLLVAANLRPALTSVGPVLPALRADLGLSATAAGWLSALPLLAFAATSPLVPRIARGLGAERTVLVALAVLLAGTLLRSGGGSTALFAGTVVLAGGIAAANVLLPVVVVGALPQRVSAVTSWYVATMTLVAALASGLAVPVAEASRSGWRTALGCWSALAVLGAALWLPTALRARRERRARRAAGAAAPAARRLPWGSPLAWAVTTYLALQSLGFYTMVAWLPTIAADAGTSARGAGLLLLLYQLVGLVAGLLVPLLVRRSPDQRAVAAGAALLSATGFGGLALLPSLAPVWVCCAGAGAGLSFTLALTLVALRSADAPGAASLSAMAQTAGYLVAAAGPLLAGALGEATGGWTAPLLVLVAVAVVNAAAGLRAGRSAVVA
ncbi:MFS transporter [Quadrisphaera sp. DSM 44207]|uniref:MFS transporter n=1 Tax=Quadrisphaera sp. DSM 44207 TaxID=1881057 RepID=UPI000891A943|nr:MFS transporter [Quadrisphaera sp. DSM 44207]SDQ15123.1 MFS transporter, CP family, cyanate transporter [Quadrisphaera sp. DSM 44207]